MSDRATLIRWLRDTVVGLRLFERRLEDGKVEARAMFTFQGEAFDIKLEAAADALETVVKNAIVTVQKRTGAQRNDERDAEERAIVEATMRGDNELATRLGHELVHRNENVGRRLPLRTTTGKWER